MEVVMQMMYSYSLELLAAAVGLMLLLELVTLRKINKWKKKEKAENRRRMERERVRETYANKKEVEVIPATVNIDSIDRPITKVAAYCRVSTLEDAQAGSFERQIQHFREMIENTEGWKNVGIYADEGASGTNMKSVQSFSG